MNMMRKSPSRPIILKRRKLPFQRNEADKPQSKSAMAPGAQSFPGGVCIMDHPTRPDTQVVVIPKTADIQSVINALTAKGKEHGPQGPNKFILLSRSNGSKDVVKALGRAASEHKNNLRPAACVAGDAKPLLTSRLKNEEDCSVLENSPTNIQWLGRMNTHAAGAQLAKNDSNKENVEGCVPLQGHTDREVSAVKGPLFKRPPYSYVVMIQFAINSKTNKKMTLKDIYHWIEDHFPYFRNVAKPGWKNSIRHNLSLHDMFVRESTSDGKISYWTIKPEANRCLTLDQVYKPAIDSGAPTYPQTMEVCYQQQQKQVLPDPKKATPCTTDTIMKPLLPQTDSYFMPIQLPLTPPSLSLPSSPTVFSLSAPQQSTCASRTGCKRLCIAPKVLKSESSSVVMSTPVPEVKEESTCVPINGQSCSSKRKGTSSSRRKQCLIPLSTEEPVLLFPESTFFDSGVASDISVFHEVEMDTEPWCDLQLENETSKMPIKGIHPASSIPSRVLEPWRVTPLGRGSHSVLDFSPIGTPQQHEHSGLSFSSTPFEELSLFSSSSKLLTSCSHELQTSSPNRSLTKGLGLDIMNDSLTKILIDISFSGLEDEDMELANLSWSQFIPELK